MLRINQVKLRVSHTWAELQTEIQKILGISSAQILHTRIYKQSLDARRKPDIYYVYAVDVQVSNEKAILKKKKKQVQFIKEETYDFFDYISPSKLPSLESNRDRDGSVNPPIVVGSGPAGLFAAYLLAQAGLRPLILERGAPVEERIVDVNRFWDTGELNPNSNVQFGEGGAGTFSDGKLNTLVNDKHMRHRFVLETFVAHGAPKSILYEQKPHIGTDILIQVVRNLRESIKSLGGIFHFHACLTDIVYAKEQNKGIRLQEILVTLKEKDSVKHRTFYPSTLILAIGHSARDTFEMLFQRKIPMSAKSFAVGLRIEHPQEQINLSQYGVSHSPHLPAATYKLAEQLENGRGVYSFCMCPGGYVVNASSEEKGVTINGMSYHGRDGKNANSAIVVTVTLEDFKRSNDSCEIDYYNDHLFNDALAGMYFQRALEQKAFGLGVGKVPVQRLEDFLNNRPGEKLGSLAPCIKGEWELANLHTLFPADITSSLGQGIQKMGRKIKGFDHPDALLSGVETRTSSPLRILRDNQYQSEVKGIYPCGEGAGYAGGITSAAIDGIKVAETILGTLVKV